MIPFLKPETVSTMCRLLCVKSREPFAVGDRLDHLAEISRNSKEYQGHGWGCAYLLDGEWVIYRNIKPIWEDDLGQFGRTTLLLGHARSAFRDENIVVENNMPFYDGNYVFAFNGELRGVRIKEAGRIGAEKIFNYVKRFDKGDMGAALRKGMDIIEKRTRYVRAMNTIIANKEKVYVSSVFNEDPDYFTMRLKQGPGELMISSEVVADPEAWTTIANGSVECFP
jgi:predicted glutamine amidotransferase